MSPLNRRSKRSQKKSQKPDPSKRYTPPIPNSYKESSKWVVVLMFGLLVAGFAVIILNYFPGSPLLPGDSSNANILIGLGLITGGFLTSTQLR